MNIFRNNHPAAVLGVVSLLLLPAAQIFGQTTKLRTKPAVTTTAIAPVTSDTGSGTTTTATTDPVGYTALPLQANSDTLVSIPFTRPAAFVGAIGSISGSTITVASTPGWTANQYVYASGTQSNTYYAIIGPLLNTVSGTVTATNGSTAITATAGLSGIAVGDELVLSGLAYNVASVTNDTALTLSRAFTGTSASGLSASYDHSPKEGSYYTVTANGTNTLTVNLNGDTLSAVAANTTVSLIPYWTLGTAFPAANAGISFTASTSTATRNYQTQISLPDMTDAGINLAAASSYFNYNGAWRLAGSDGTVAYDDTVLPPTSNFFVRNTAASTTFTPTGGVYMNRITAPLDAQTAGSQDNAVSVPRPVAVALNDLGLITSGAFTPSASPATRNLQDTLSVYDNSTVGINKAALATYYYYNGAWRLTGTDGTVDYGTTTIPYGAGFTIRKVAATAGATSFWQNTRTY